MEEDTNIREGAASEISDTIEADKRKFDTTEYECERKKAFGIVQPIPHVKTAVLCNLCPIITMAFNGVFCCPEFSVFIDFNVVKCDEIIRLAVKYREDLAVSADYKRYKYAYKFTLDNIKVHDKFPYVDKAVSRLVADDFMEILQRLGFICSAVWKSEDAVV